MKCCMMTDPPVINAVAQPQCHLERTEGGVASVAAHFPEQRDRSASLRAFCFRLFVFSVCLFFFSADSTADSKSALSLLISTIVILLLEVIWQLLCPTGKSHS